MLKRSLCQRRVTGLVAGALMVGRAWAAPQAEPASAPPPPPPPPSADAGAPSPPPVPISADGGAVSVVDGGANTQAAPPPATRADGPAAAGPDGGVPPSPAPVVRRRPPPPSGPLPGRTVVEPVYPLPPPWNGELSAPTDEDTAEYQAVVDEFGVSAADIRKEISDLVQAQYKERRSRLRDEYEVRIQAMEREEARRRLLAIERFEKFLGKYPSDPTYTPDAIFRLAELYFEQTTEDFQAALRRYDEDLQAFERGDLKIEPEQPEHHYEKTIALYQRLITEFPEHRLLDGAFYLLGYCLDEQGESDQAIVQFLELTRRFPESRFYSESWMRVGEYYFDNDKLPESIAAYNHVLEAPDSSYYDKALYKLGWSHYRLNQYEEAIARFLQVLDYSEQRKKETGEEGSDLVPESLQYIAVSLSDDYWDRGIGYDPISDETGEVMVDFAQQYFKKLNGRAYERDVFIRLGDILFDASKYPGAVKAFEHVLALAPLHPEAPQEQDKVVQSWERERDFDKSSVARELLVKNYSEGTPWYTANKDNIEAIRTAQNLARTSLYSAAIFHHTQAQKWQSQDKYDLAKVEYEQAANGYREYLKRFPHDRNAYELNWYFADTLYNSLQFREASTEFARVRDSTAGTKYRAEAAINVYYGLLKLIEDEEQSGRMAKPAPVNKAEALPPAVEIPPLKQELLEACDLFVERAPADERVPAVKATAAEILYTYGHFEEARPRLDEVLEKYPDKDVAKVAASYIMQYLLTKKDWEGVERFAQYVQSRNVGDQGEYRTLELGALFQKAKMFMDQGESLLGQGKNKQGNKRLEQAAGEYVRLVEQNKEHEFADKALFNAALAYEKAGRFDSALKLYERVYSEYDKSELAPTALWLVADNAYKSYDFSKAIETFQKLVKTYPDSPKRADSQFNAALTLENLQRYGDAAVEYEKYSKLFPKREDAAAVFFKAATVQEKRGDKRAYVATLNRFIKKYKKDPAQTDLVVEAYARLADSLLASGKQKDAGKLYKQAVDEFAKRKGNPQGPGGYHAARSTFQLAEFSLKRYEQLKVDGKSKQQLKRLEVKSKELKKMADLYNTVLPYKQLEWSLAAAYRLGYVYENLAESVLSAPCPSDVKRVGIEACDEYRIFVEDRLAAPLEQKAAAAYTIAVKQAEDSKFQNTWTRLTKEHLSRYTHEPVDKEPKRRFAPPQFAGLDVVLPPEQAEKKNLKGK